MSLLGGYDIRNRWLVCPENDLHGAMALQIPQMASIRAVEGKADEAEIRMASGATHTVRVSYKNALAMLAITK